MNECADKTLKLSSKSGKETKLEYYNIYEVILNCFGNILKR